MPSKARKNAPFSGPGAAAKPPTREEQRLYPHLVKRGVWPPEPSTPGALSREESQEFERYKNRDDLFLIEDDVRIEDPSTLNVEPDTLEEFAEGLESYEHELLERATSLPMTGQEQEILASVGQTTERARKAVMQMILQTRVDRLRRDDTAKARAEIRKKLNPELRKMLEENGK